MESCFEREIYLPRLKKGCVCLSKNYFNLLLCFHYFLPMIVHSDCHIQTLVFLPLFRKVELPRALQCSLAFFSFSFLPFLFSFVCVFSVMCNISQLKTLNKQTNKKHSTKKKQTKNRKARDDDEREKGDKVFVIHS